MARYLVYDPITREVITGGLPIVKRVINAYLFKHAKNSIDAIFRRFGDVSEIMKLKSVRQEKIEIPFKIANELNPIIKYLETSIKVDRALGLNDIIRLVTNLLYVEKGIRANRILSEHIMYYRSLKRFDIADVLSRCFDPIVVGYDKLQWLGVIICELTEK